MRVTEAIRRMGEGAGLAAFYRGWAAAVSAGLPMARALELQVREDTSKAAAERARHLLESIRAGGTLAEGCARAGQRMLALESDLVALGEERGRLDDVLRVLAAFFESDARVARRLLRRAVYPLMQALAAGFILPLPLIFWIDAWAYLLLLVTSWLAVFFFGGSILVARFARERGCTRWAMARLCWALATAYEVGVPTAQAMDLAARVVEPSPLAAALRALPPELRSSKPPSELLAMTGEAPAIVISTLQNAELTGETEGTLRKLGTLFEDGTIEGALIR